MKKVLCLMCCTFAMLCPLVNKAQVISSEVSSQYPPSIIVKVYDVASVVNLGTNKQKKLAKHFAKEDSTLSAMILNGADASSISNAVANFKNDFQDILSSSEKNAFYSSKIDANAKKEGDIMGGIIQQKYQCDSSFKTLLTGLYYNRAFQSQNIVLQNTNADTVDKKLNRVFKKYDSLIAKYTYVARSNIYIKKKIDTLNSIKPLTAQQSDHLKTYFFNLCTKSESLVDNFNKALRFTTTDMDYYSALYKNRIEQQALTETKKSIDDLLSKKRIVPSQYQDVYPIVYEKKKALATINAVYPSAGKTRDSLTKAVYSHYDPLLSAFSETSKMQTSAFSIAIWNKDSLNLTNSQIDLLKGKADILKHKRDSFQLRDPYGKFDSKIFESDALPVILSEDQYTKLLKIKNRSEAKDRAEQDWNEMVQRGISGNHVQSATIVKLKRYHLLRLMASNRYANNKIQLSANLKSIDADMPNAMKALKTARRNNNPVNGSQGVF